MGGLLTNGTPFKAFTIGEQEPTQRSGHGAAEGRHAQVAQELVHLAGEVAVATLRREEELE